MAAFTRLNPCNSHSMHSITTDNAGRFRQLIYSKYGEEKFAVACLIVSMFVGFKSKHKWTPEKVRLLCHPKPNLSTSICLADVNALKQLFGHQQINQLFS